MVKFINILSELVTEGSLQLSKKPQKFRKEPEGFPFYTEDELAFLIRKYESLLLRDVLDIQGIHVFDKNRLAVDYVKYYDQNNLQTVETDNVGFDDYDEFIAVLNRKIPPK